MQEFNRRVGEEGKEGRGRIWKRREEGGEGEQKGRSVEGVRKRETEEGERREGGIISSETLLYLM